MSSVPLPRWKRFLFGTVTLAGAVLIPLTLVEGGSSLVLLANDLSQPVGQLAERSHTEYDTLLGWVGRPTFYEPDVYGRGVYLRTNSQGFRNDHPIAPHVPQERVRLICSGDSFTLGWGVDNDHTWCALLERMNCRLETVNMGQGGYGADQAYLWYKRDAKNLDHDLQVFAVILEDFQRFRRRSFQGFGKPVLRLDGDTLAVENVPVPRRPYRMPRLASYLYWERQSVERLRAVQLARRISHHVGRRHPGGAVDADSATWLVANRMLRDLVNLNRVKHSRLVVVFLPIRLDWTSSGSDRWRHWLAGAANRDGYLFVDLVDDFRRVPHDSLDLLFLDRRDLYSHYGNGGHEWVASQLYRRLGLGFAERDTKRSSPPIPPPRDTPPTTAVPPPPRPSPASVHR